MVNSAPPRWANLSVSDIQKIQVALKGAESKTSGEIVPMIVRRSSPVSFHAPMILGWLLIGWLLAAPALWQQSLWWWVLSLAAGLALSYLLAQLPWVQRWLTRIFIQEDFVMTRARLEFYEFNVHHTAGATGVLIFASMMERQVVVLADSAISQKLPPETWQNVCDHLVAGLKQGEVAEGFLKAIELCGELLSEHFPLQGAGRNELSDHLILKE